MWRSLRRAASKKKGLMQFYPPKCSYATSGSQSGGGGSMKKPLIALVAITSVGAGATIAYGKYDPEFRKLIESNVPYSNVIFKSLPDWKQQNDNRLSLPTKVKDAPQETSLLKKKLEREGQKKDEKVTATTTIKETQPVKQKEDKLSQHAPIISQAPSEEKSFKIPSPPPSIVDETIALENTVKDLLENLENSTKEATLAYDEAIEAIKTRNNKLYRALESPSGNEVEFQQSLKQVDVAGSKVKSAVDLASDKSSTALTLLEKLKTEIKRSKENGTFSRSSILFAGENTAQKMEKILKEGEAKIAAAEAQSKAASDYRELVNKAREDFKDELRIVLPKYVHKNKDQAMTQEELNLLIAHAHKRIEQLQKELAKQKVTESDRISEGIKAQKSSDESAIEARMALELSKYRGKLEDEFHEQFLAMQDEYESDLRQQLRRQAAVHADHLQEALKIQNSELERHYEVELQDQLLQQKGVFISEISSSIAKLKEMETYLKVRAQLNEAARKTQALWVACQAMKNSIKSGFSEKPKPLGKELAIIKSSVDDESHFLNTILSGIPLQAVERGIYTDECLKERFNKVKRICKQVALIDDNNNSLFRYMFSYLQSVFIIDQPGIPQEEQENKVAVDPAEWDTFDVLNRITFCLQRNDFVQALRYANQLHGEPRNVARSWIYELQLMLETSQAVDCLIAYASAIGLQSYN